MSKKPWEKSPEWTRAYLQAFGDAIKFLRNAQALLSRADNALAEANALGNHYAEVEETRKSVEPTRILFVECCRSTRDMMPQLMRLAEQLQMTSWAPLVQLRGELLQGKVTEGALNGAVVWLNELSSRLALSLFPGPAVTSDDGGKTIGIKEAAQRQGVNISTVTRRCQNGKIAGAISPDDPSNTTGEWKIPDKSVPRKKGNPTATAKRKRESPPSQRQNQPDVPTYSCKDCGKDFYTEQRPRQCTCGFTQFESNSPKRSAV